MSYEAILFDMNGVLVDDEQLHEEAFRRVLGRQGYEFTPEQYKEYFAGRTDEEGFRAFFGGAAPDGIIEEKHSVYMSLAADGLEGYGGTQEFIQAASEAGLDMAVVTSSSREEADMILGSLGLKTFFRTVVSAEDIRKGKPDPEGYLKAAGALRVEPAKCLVIEDSPSGISAAKQAGMMCLAVTNTHTREELAPADKIVDALSPELLPEIAG